jgi:hypothetical protein
MMILHNLKGQMIGQVLKALAGEDVKLLGSNINRAEGAEWQTVVKFRRISPSFPVEYDYCLCMHSVYEKEPYFILLTENEARQKLKAWGYSASEVEKLITQDVVG